MSISVDVVRGGDIHPALLVSFAARLG